MYFNHLILQRRIEVQDYVMGEPELETRAADAFRQIFITLLWALGQRTFI